LAGFNIKSIPYDKAERTIGKPQYNFMKRFPKYFTVYLISYVVNIGLLKYFVSSFDFDPFYIQFAIIPLVMGINFFGFKYWSLK